jgi:transposase
LPVSKDTLLRVVRRHAIQLATEPSVVGIDDWAWKRGHRYGTIVCDLEQRRIIDILPDREAATVTAWLARHPSITVISRDRGAGYKQAATDGRPEAVPVADRWHLMENASAAFLNAVRQSMQAIRKAVGIGAVDPASLSAAEPSAGNTPGGCSARRRTLRFWRWRPRA